MRLSPRYCTAKKMRMNVHSQDLRRVSTPARYPYRQRPVLRTLLLMLGLGSGRHSSTSETLRKADLSIVTSINNELGELAKPHRRGTELAINIFMPES